MNITVNSSFAQKGYTNNINWEKFLSAHDLIFDQMLYSWEEAPYFGNGFIGSMIYGNTSDRKQFNIQVFKTDGQDHYNDSSGWTAYSRPRLPIGYFTITLKGKIISSHLRMHLFTADLTGDIETTRSGYSRQYQRNGKKLHFKTGLQKEPLK